MKRPAFTIIECVCSLLITTIIILLVSFLMTDVKKLNLHNLDPELDWYLFLQEMEAPKHHFILLRVQKHHLYLKSEQSRLDYTLHGYTNLYLTGTSTGGYLPLLDDVAPDQFSFNQLDDRRVQVEVKRTNGKIQRGIIKFYEPRDE